MRENGELDVENYEKIKADMAKLVKPHARPEPFPTQADQMKYPGNALKIGNPLYMTSNMSYGSNKPSQVDLPAKYYPRPGGFTASFVGGQYVEGSLITVQTPSKVHNSLDQ